MRVFADINEVAAAKGEYLGYTEWVRIDQDRIDLFADSTGDHQWIHVDEERAAKGPFGTTIAHGFLSLSMLSYFSPRVIEVRRKPSMSINYGLDKVRFLQPVTVDSLIRDGVVLSDVKETPKGLFLTMTHTVEIQGQERPALVADSLSLWVP